MPATPSPAPPSASDAALAALLMRRQGALSVRVAAVFLVLVLGVPLLTHFAPEFCQQPLFGFPLSWLLLGIVFYPLTWVLSTYFVRISERMETEEAALVREERPRP